MVDVFGRQIAFECETDPHQRPPVELGVRGRRLEVTMRWWGLIIFLGKHTMERLEISIEINLNSDVDPWGGSRQNPWGRAGTFQERLDEVILRQILKKGDEYENYRAQRWCYTGSEVGGLHYQYRQKIQGTVDRFMLIYVYRIE